MTRAAEDQVVVIDYQTLVSLSTGQEAPDVHTSLTQQIEQVKRLVALVGPVWVDRVLVRAPGIWASRLGNFDRGRGAKICRTQAASTASGPGICSKLSLEYYCLSA